MATPEELGAFVQQIEGSDPAGFAAPIEGGAPTEPFQRDLRGFVDQLESGQPEGRAAQISEFVSTTEKDLLDELVSGSSAGTDQLQMSLFGLARLAGREMNFSELEDFGDRGIDRNVDSLKLASPTIQSFSSIESFDDFFRWAAGGLGQAAPSLASAVAGGGIGGIIGKKAIEMKLKGIIRDRMTRTMAKKGIANDVAAEAAERALRSRAGLDMVMNGMRNGVSNATVLNRGFARGASLGAVSVSGPPQSGEAALAGIDDPLVVFGVGLLGGALEALPALRLIDKMFPGVDRAISTSFIRDFAKASGSQAILEGSTEGAQEFIQLAAMAYHDPTFDLLNPDNATQIIDAFAAGALVGAVTGGGSQAVGGATNRSNAEPAPRPKIPEFKIPDATPEGDFATNTVMQEVAGQVNAVVQGTLGPALNTIRNSFQQGVDQVSRAVPSLNESIEKLKGRAQQAQEEFIEGHQPIIDDTVRFAKEQIEFITENAQQIIGDTERKAWINEQLADLKEQVSEVATQLGDRAKKVVDSVSSQVDGISVFDDTFTNPEVESDTEFTFGKQVNKEATRGEQAQPLKSRKSARGLIERLRKRFPSATDSTFGIRETEGGFIVALEDSGQREALIEDEVLSQGVDNARQSGRDSPDKNRQAEVQMEGVAGKTRIDVPTLINAGRKLDSGDNQTIQQGFLAMAGRLLDRGIIGDDGFAALNTTFNRLYPKQADKEASIRQSQSTASEVNPDDITQEVDPEGELNRDTAQAREEQVDEEARDVGKRTKAIPNKKGRTKVPKPKLQSVRNAEQKAARKKAAARRAKPAKKATKRRAEPANQAKLTSKARVQVYMPGVKGVTREAINQLAKRIANLLSPDTNIRIINREAALRMVQDDHDHKSIASELLDHSRFAVKYQKDGPTYILVDDFEDAGQSITALIHEMGHVLHYDTWAQLSETEQDKLWEAFVADVNSGTRQTGSKINRSDKGQTARHAKASINNFEFREWMADQFVDWMNNRRQPKSAIEKFMETVAQKMDQVWDFISRNPGRFNQLNHTYADFADAVALRVAREDATNNTNWFQNEGAAGRPISVLTDANEGIIPKGVTEREWNEIKTRIEDTYPAVAARSKSITEWLHNAYHLVLAPSTSVMRSLSEKGIKSADRLVGIFNRAEHGKAKLSRNYHQRIKLIKGQFTNRYENITRGMETADKASLMKRMREMDGNSEIQPQTLKERQMRKLFDDLHDYLKNQGLPVGKIPNYFPRTFSREKLVANEQKIIAWFMRKQSGQPRSSTTDEAKAFFNSLISSEADSAAALAEIQADEISMQSPSFRNMRSRTVRDGFFDQFLDNNLDGVVSNYIVAATKRGEYNRALGSKAPEGVIGGDRLARNKWNPQGELDSIISDAKKEGATDEDLKKMKSYVEANLGQYGRDLVPDSVRTAMSTVVAYQNMRVLLFTVFASLPDLVGPAIRSGDMKGSFESFVKNIKKTVTTQNELDEMARAWGVVSSAGNQHIMTEYVDNHYMPPGVRKWNDAFFKYTGLNFYTDFTRKMALGVGRDTIKRQAAKVNDQSLTQKQRDRAKQFLAEFGLTSDSVTTWVEQGERTWGGIGYDQESANDQQIAEALVQFVDESIMSPNASQRPIAASHPAMMLVFHLKGFIYAMHDTILKRLAHNFKIADTPAQVLAAIAPAVLMLALTAIGLELRELVTGDRRTDRMDGWEYTWTTVERSGLLGISQLGFDFEDAGARGQAEFAAMSGPAVGQLGDLISKPFSQTIPKAIPVVSQLPWARNALRDATPL